MTNVTYVCIFFPGTQNGNAGKRGCKRKGTRRRDWLREDSRVPGEERETRVAPPRGTRCDRYESYIAERPTTKSRHVRHGAWKMLGKGGRVAYQRALAVARIVDHTGVPIPPPAVVSSVSSEKDPRGREQRGGADSLVRPIPRWRLILKPLICPPWTFHTPPTA